MADRSLEAKICVLGAQGVGKTSLVQRYVHGTFASPLSTVGASFATKTTTDADSGATVRLQIWDTAGQERYRSISQLYYRGASAVVLVYSIVDEPSFREMGRWLQEVRDSLGDDAVIHVVGTKADVAADHPAARAVPFDRCIAYVADQLSPGRATPPAPAAATTPGAASLLSASLGYGGGGGGGGGGTATPGSFDSTTRRHSGFWLQDAGWDDCHEVSASTGEGVDEVFRVVTRKLVERRQRKLNEALVPEPGAGLAAAAGVRGGRGYLDRPLPLRGDSLPRRGSPGPGGVGAAGSRPGTGDKRRSWLGFPASVPADLDEGGLVDIADHQAGRRTRCC